MRPRQPHVNDAARRIVVKRMREEHFNHALTVLEVVRFSRGGLRGVFLPLAGACGRQGFWAWACACDSRNAVGGMRGGEGVARRGQKPLGRSPGASFLSPLSLAIQRKGARGWRGRAAPGEWRGLPRVPRCELRQDPHVQGEHSLRSASPLPRCGSKSC